MHDIKTEIKRSHEMRNGKLVVIRTQEGENGANRFVRVITEEEGITMKEVKEVLEVAVPRELEKADREISRLQKEFEEVKIDVEKFEKDPEFVKFYEFNERKDTGLFFEMLKLSPEAQEKAGLTRNRDFQNFKKYVSKPGVNELSKNLKRMNEMAQKEKQIEEALKKRVDILDWKKQFDEIKETLEK